MGTCTLRDWGYSQWGWGPQHGRCCRWRNNIDCAGELVHGVISLPLPDFPDDDLAMTPARKQRAMQLMTIFENARTTPAFGFAEYLGDGQGITFGFIGFCTGTYDGNMVVKRYCERRPGNILCKYIPALDRIDASGGGDSLVGLSGFVEDVRRAAADVEFINAQIDLHDSLYYNKMRMSAHVNGVRFPLTIAQMYDAWIQHGQSGVWDMVAAVNDQLGGNPASGVDEKQWLDAFLTRRKWVLWTTPGKGNVWRVSTPRVDVYREIMQTGNWRLDGPISISRRPAPVGGFRVTNTYYGEFLLP